MMCLCVGRGNGRGGETGFRRCPVEVREDGVGSRQWSSSSETLGLVRDTGLAAATALPASPSLIFQSSSSQFVVGVRAGVYGTVRGAPVEGRQGMGLQAVARQQQCPYLLML